MTKESAIVLFKEQPTDKEDFSDPYFNSTSDRHTVLATVSRDKPTERIYSPRPRGKHGLTTSFYIKNNNYSYKWRSVISKDNYLELIQNQEKTGSIA
jgi:hypothetical protein